MKISGDASGVAVRVCSGEPWRLSLTAWWVGSDLVCRVHGGDEHIGAVALAQWDGVRAKVTGKVIVDEHCEGPLATVIAHQLSRAARTTVTCIAGIHYDGLKPAEIKAIEAAAYELSASASKQLDDLRIERDLDRDSCPLGEITAIAGELGPSVEAMLAKPVEDLIAAARTGGGEGGGCHKVQLFAPLYLSNACPNDCSYCGFRRSADFERKNLNLCEALREAQALSDSGFRAIDLVTGEIPTDSFIASVCEAIEAIRSQTEIEHLNLNLGALSLEQYQRLLAAGATGYNLYQETYDRATYREVHIRGHKRDMAARLVSSLDAVDAGFEHIGLGVLLGLREPAFDLACVLAHARVLLARRAGSGGDTAPLSIGFSLPRIVAVDHACDYTPGFSIDNDLFIKCVLTVRALNSDAGITLTSREPETVRETLLPLGITKISAGVSTSPGGYTQATHESKAQFVISDERSLDEMSAMIRTMGLEPVL
jgi:2-iminoacetate synthase